MEPNTENGPGEQGEQATARIINNGQLLDYICRVIDGRKRRWIRYLLEIILVLFILAKLSGENRKIGIADWV